MDHHFVLLTAILFIILTIEGVTGEPMLSVAPRYTSLSGDLDAIFNLTRLFNARTNVTLRAEAFVTCDDHGDALTKVQFDVMTSEAVGKFAFKCGTIVYGGFCAIKLITKMNNSVTEIVTSGRFEVRWPSFRITAPTSLETFTSDVTVSVEATGIACPPTAYGHRTWLELSYIRHNETSSTAINNRLIVDVNEFYKIVSRDFIVSCSFFDQPGSYRIRLKTNSKKYYVMSSSAIITVKWSEQYSVAFESGFPCSVSTGVIVVYQHPKCVLSGDKIRVYGRVSGPPNAPAASPFVYNYIQEKRVELRKNSVTFTCDVFNGRRYVEYCAKYVSKAQHGAVSEVRSTCVSTQGNVEMAVDGSWSSWSTWSACTGNCAVGTRTRHRVCDNPSPSPGGRFCLGHPVQSEACTLSKCPDRTTVQSPVDTYHMSDQCRCGCQINMTTTTVYVASSGFNCPSAAASWVFIASLASVLRFTFVHFDLNDTVECLQIRNGQLPSSELLLHETGRNLPKPVVTSVPVALLRYHSTPGLKPESGGRLGLGFVVRVEPIISTLSGLPMASDGVDEGDLMVFSPLHLAALVFCVILVCFTLSLVGQHIWNVIRKRPSDLSPQSPLTSSPGSFRGGFYPPFHPVTSTTSISEVSLMHQPQLRRNQRRQRKKYGPKSASLDSIASSQVCRSPEDYLRDSKLFQTSLSSLDSQLSVESQDVLRSPSPNNAKSNNQVIHQRQQPPPLLQKQSPLTPGMTRKLPVATVSPQPARVVSPSLGNKPSSETMCSNVDKKKLNDKISISESSKAAVAEQSNRLSNPVKGRQAMAVGKQTENVETDRKKKKLETVSEQSKCGGPGPGNVSLTGVRMRPRQGRRHEPATNSTRTLMASLSEFSLSENDEDNFEYDYYDYGMNMHPGSYLSGQYPSWLPPFLPVQPSPYNLDVPMQHFDLSGGGSNSNPNSRPISDASNYQESSADSLMSAAPPQHPTPMTGAYNQAVQSPLSPRGRPIDKTSRVDDPEK